MQKRCLAIVCVVAASTFSLLASAPDASAAVRRAFPRPGAIKPTPPLLRWRVIPRAILYNVQLYRGRQKILSRFPRRPRLDLRWSWTYNGHRYRLRPAIYRWYVWPWFGSRYGRLRVRSWFIRAVSPANVSPPTITGSAREGLSLTASAGRWRGTRPMRLSYQWRRCDETGGACARVPGATSATLTLGAGDIGHTLAVVVTARNLARSRSASSEPTGTVVPMPPQNVSRPVVSGRFQEGRTLAAAVGIWASSRPIAYSLSWQRCGSRRNCRAIRGATDGSYRLSAADVEARVRVLVRATNEGGATAKPSAVSPVVGRILIGTAAPDLIRGSLGADVIRGRGADDTLYGRAGNDRLVGGPDRDRVVGGPGDDRLVVRDRRRDVVNCGRGADRVVADGRDRVAANCEIVTRA
jgi:hypothetical protein